MGAALGLLLLIALPALAEQGTRLHTQHDVLWLGSLSTGYVVGTSVSSTEFLRLEYMKVPISHLQVLDANTGETMWEGHPYIGQLLSFDASTHAKFIVWSAPMRDWPGTDQPAIQKYDRERPVLDAMQFKIINR